MRPLELKLRNFRSYFGDESRFDFTDRRLLGIVGPIGSGKSSLLDAIAFALYGRTPSVAANTKSLIHQRADECTVALRFEVEGEVWEAVRMLRRRGASQHALYRYDPDDDEPVERVTLEADVNARIGELLGLEFDAFGRSVLLAQGHFAEFLTARPAERDKVLKGVFGHDKIDAMREAAKRRAGEAAVEVEKLDVRVTHLDELGEVLAARRAELAVVEERSERLEAVSGEVEQLTATIAESQDAQRRAESELLALGDVRRRFPDTSDVRRVVDAAAAAAGLRADWAGKLEAARVARVDAEAELIALREAGEPATLEQAGDLVARLESVRQSAGAAAARAAKAGALAATRSGEAEAAAERVEQHATAVDEATKLAARASEALSAATEALHDAQHADMSAELRSGLEPGRPCPVCAQQVHVVPEPVDAPQLEAARSAHAAAAAAHERAVSEREAAARAHAAAVADKAAAERGLAAAVADKAAAEDEAAAAESEVDALRDEITALLGDGEPADLLAARRRALAEAETVAAKARDAVDRARAGHDQAIRDEQDAGKALSALRVDLADLGARLGTTTGNLEETPEAVSALLDELQRLSDDAVEAATEAVKEASRASTTATDRLAELLTELGVEGGDYRGAVGEARGRRDSLRSEITRAEDEIAAGAGLVAERDTRAAVKAAFERVAADLTDSKFVRYLLDDERSRLAALGSDHFLRLTSGRYEFSGDGRFDVVDLTAAEAVRKAESLSGGETFLASLALALALAEMVARTGGRLDAFFLDEGFGSLDPEHLDLAMDGIEALVAGTAGRLVVVVSHVPEMRDRIEDLIVLDRDAVTGDTRILRA